MRNPPVFSRALFFLSNILLPLTAGLMIYVLFQSDVPIVKVFPRISGIALDRSADLPGWLHAVIRNYLPDACWAYALFFSLVWILGDVNPGFTLAFIISAAASALTETAQLLALIPGTFDFLDILTEIVSVTLGLFIIKRFERNPK